MKASISGGLPMKLGMVTYNIAANWNLDTILDVCTDVGIEGVEFRTTHAHGVEVTLTREERETVREKCAAAGVEIAGLGSVFEYHSPDPAELRRNIDGSKGYILLARDVGTSGIKVRPNALPDGVPVEKTLEQIGIALREVGEFGEGEGIEIRLEVHGRGTNHVPYLATILDICGHPNVKACWNSNLSDLTENNRLKPYYDLLAGRIGLVHINRLHCGYPYAELFSLLKTTGYAGFALAEIPAAGEVETAKELLRYYRQVFNLLGGDAS